MIEICLFFALPKGRITITWFDWKWLESVTSQVASFRLGSLYDMVHSKCNLNWKISESTSKGERGLTFISPHGRVTSNHTNYALTSSSLHCFEVPLTPKHSFHKNESLHLFETHCGHLFFLLTNPATLYASKPSIFCSRSSQKGSVSIPDLTSQSTLHACLQRENVM